MNFLRSLILLAAVLALLVAWGPRVDPNGHHLAWGPQVDPNGHHLAWGPRIDPNGYA